MELFSALYASGKWTIQELKQPAGLNFLRVWREVEKVCILRVQKMLVDCRIKNQGQDFRGQLILESAQNFTDKNCCNIGEEIGFSL